MLPAFAADAVQVVATVGPVDTVLQVVSVQPLPELAGAATHDAAKLGPVKTVLQVVAV